ncbi:MAG: hypothetical protein VR72_19845 [Clostridiaceae bacterium BRH_c20a]|nr:MAG: hypothetical protein VR72_19845 [Clostridiaceae bacterium BRH_c20a]
MIGDSESASPIVATVLQCYSATEKCKQIYYNCLIVQALVLDQTKCNKKEAEVLVKNLASNFKKCGDKNE